MDATESSAVDAEFAARLLSRLEPLYGGAAQPCLEGIVELAEGHLKAVPQQQPRLWNERDVVLITYGDQILPEEGPTLPVLGDFLARHKLPELINTVHILPFCPYSSDDGFSVIDYRQVNPEFGTWHDVRQLGTQVNLMFDLVLNHCSQHSAWFQGFLAQEAPYDKYFVCADPADDLSAVTRPRSLPLLTAFETAGGTRHVWTTFSADQVDLNFADPAVLLDMLDVLLLYVRQGARIIRLDAIGYLWKEVGTKCIHLPQTHEIVKLFRDVLDAVAPHVLLMTETNVPHEENVSYFGDQDEAQLVYQFSLPPLLLDAFLSEDTGPFTCWLRGVCETVPGTNYFNFTASHDGIGVRPLEGLVRPERITRLVDAARARGGHVSTKREANGNDTPYELNISYFDALGEPAGLAPELHARRFLSSQAVMLSLRGVPGIYFHSLVGTPNYHEGVTQSGQNRRINRRRYGADELHDILAGGDNAASEIFAGYRRLLAARIVQPAFHPDGVQEVVDMGEPALLAFRRRSLDDEQHVLVATNVSRQPVRVPTEVLAASQVTRELIFDGPPEADGEQIILAPFQTGWFELRR